MNADELLQLRDNPPRMGRLANEARREHFGDAVLVVETPRHPRPERSAIVRGGDLLRCEDWPAPETWRAGDAVLVRVEPGDGERWASYLVECAGAAPAGCALVPFSDTAAGIHRLWTIASARVALGPRVRVQARHDLIGIRVAQVALGFGADTLAGPVQPDRTLPLAGVTRPNENTHAGLRALVEQAGLTPAEAST